MRASLTIGASCMPAVASIRTSSSPNAARFGGLHDEHALQHAAVDDRHAEERLVGILAGLAEVLETRMRRRVLHDDGAHLLGDQTGQTFGDAHADAADAFRPQPDRGREHQRGPIRLEQIDRADVGDEPLLNQIDDVGECFGGIAAARDEMADLFERPEKRGVGLHGRPARVARSLPRRICQRILSNSTSDESFRFQHFSRWFQHVRHLCPDDHPGRVRDRTANNCHATK